MNRSFKKPKPKTKKKKQKREYKAKFYNQKQSGIAPAFQSSATLMYYTMKHKTREKEKKNYPSICKYTQDACARSISRWP